MDIAALNQEDFQVWVPFMDAEVLLRYVPLEEVQRIHRKAVRRSWDGKHRLVENLDALEANRLLGRAAVRGWRGITLEGRDYPYSEEHCDFLMGRWLEFAKFVGDVCLDLQALQQEERRRREGNSGLTSGPDASSRV